MALVLNSSSITGLSSADGLLSHQSGSIIQTVNYTNRTYFTTATTASWVSTGIASSITPRFANSKILVLASPNAMVDRVGSNDNLGWLIMDRNGTKVPGSFMELRTYDRGASGIQYVSKATMTFIDEPATTSTLTYTLYGQIQTNTTTLSVNIQETNSPTVDSSQYTATTIILMEIAA